MSTSEENKNSCSLPIERSAREIRTGSHLASRRMPGGSRLNKTPRLWLCGSLLVGWVETPSSGISPGSSAVEEKGVKLTHPLTDHAFRRRAIFFRDLDGNVIEIYAEI